MANYFVPGPTKIISGHVATDSVTDTLDLAVDAVSMPEVQDFLDYADQKGTICVLTAADSLEQALYTPETAEYKLPVVDSSAKSGDNMYRFAMQGKIYRPSVVLNQVGGSNSDGTFQLTVQDNQIFKGLNVRFPSGLLARYVSMTGSAGNYVYTFQTKDGSVYNHTTAFAGQSGTKTIVGFYTSYGENSERGYTRHVNPDMFTVFSTTQREECAITGDVASQKIWYYHTNPKTGSVTKGQVANVVWQCRMKMSMRNELQKKFGVSNMKNADGTIKTVVPLDEDGNAFIEGDGIYTQTYGANHIAASGTDGMPTVDDFYDAVMAITRNGNNASKYEIFCLTGQFGMRKIQSLIPTFQASQNVRFVKQVENMKDIGGTTGFTGQSFARLDILGNTIYFVNDPQLDDTTLFPATNSYGMNIASATFYGLVFRKTGATSKNVEILAKAANGVDRASISAYIPGMTGSGKAVTTADRDVYSYLKQDIALVRDPNLAFTLEPAA